MEFLDSHFHLMSEEFNEDREDVLKRALEAGVKHLMLITLDNKETKEAIAFNQKHNHVLKIAAGIFPEDVDKVTDEYWQEFVSLAKNEEISAIGEIGLEYHWVEDKSLRLKQRELFIRQIELAKSLHKPYLVHSRDAIQDTYDIMKKYRGHGLLHCYSGSLEMAKEFIKLGFYIAIGGALTFKNARHTLSVVKNIDENYLLTETDSPYMTPVPYRGKRNEPSYIPYVVKKMAELKEISDAKMAKIIVDNWKRFLKTSSV